MRGDKGDKGVVVVW